jgi:coenzyme F420 hydrogenase subunit beta
MTLQREVERVVRNGNCTGCGGCEWLFPTNVGMQTDEDGFLRPEVTSRGTRDDARRFRAMCPGVAVSQPHPAGAQEDQVFGPFVSSWQGWATDATIRELGSSGGVLTALNAWLNTTDPDRLIVATSSSKSSPVRSVPVRLSTRTEIEASAGSRYAPVSNLPLLSSPSSSDVFVGKPCEVAAARQAFSADAVPPESQPAMFSFFCAGTPSQLATESLVRKLGIEPDEVTRLRYRGNGWPGEFAVDGRTGESASMSYHDSWGGHLGRDLQWRCKLCPHGTGNHADISVGDYWRSDENGYPVFESGAGNSVVIARTRRGHELLLRARAEGVLVLTPLSLADVHPIQPLQVKRMATLWARLVARVLSGHRVPTYRGFGLVRRAAASPAVTARTIAGTWLRSVRRTSRKAAGSGAGGS